jgi:hypothetical protein
MTLKKPEKEAKMKTCILYEHFDNGTLLEYLENHGPLKE